MSSTTPYRSKSRRITTPTPPTPPQASTSKSTTASSTTSSARTRKRSQKEVSEQNESIPLQTPSKSASSPKVPKMTLRIPPRGKGKQKYEEVNTDMENTPSPDLDKTFNTDTTPRAKSKTTKRRTPEKSKSTSTPRTKARAKTPTKSKSQGPVDQDSIDVGAGAGDADDPYYYHELTEEEPPKSKSRKSTRATTKKDKKVLEVVTLSTEDDEDPPVPVPIVPPSTTRDLRRKSIAIAQSQIQSPLKTTTPSKSNRTRVPAKIHETVVEETPATPAPVPKPKSTRSRLNRTTGTIDKERTPISPNTPDPSPSPRSTRRSVAVKLKLPKTPSSTVAPKANKENNARDKESKSIINTPAPPLKTPGAKRPKPMQKIGQCPLPCREEQFQDVYSFLRGNLEGGDSRCMYVSGVPGTGKTAIVRAAVQNLQQVVNTIKFHSIYINGLSLASPDKIWKKFCHELQLQPSKVKSLKSGSSSSTRLTSDKALGRLKSYFENKAHEPVVLIVDELDQVLDKHQSILYTLLDWTNHPENLFSLICIFNTMNLPENALTLRNASRMGLLRCVFPPYSHEQLGIIVSSYIGEEGTSKLSEALPLLCRKVAAISGDARRALEIAKRTLELIETNNLSSTHAVQEAFKELFSSPKIRAVRSSSTLEKLILKSLVSELTATGNDSEETKVSNVISGVLSQAPYEGLTISTDAIFHCLRRLYEGKLVLIENCGGASGCGSAASIHSKISLNVGVSDVQFAMGLREGDVL